MATFIWQRRGRITLGAMVILALFFIFIAIRSTAPALATSGGDPYSVPVVVDTNPDPNIVETTITAQPAMVDIGNGVMASVLTFNGTVPGPEFRLKVGDTVIVHFKNQIAHPTGIHWHGIELANASDGTPLTQNQVPFDGTFLYKFKIPRPGIYWYHPHHHSSTNQVFKGLYGSIIVTDPYEDDLQALGTIPSASQTLTLALSDITVCKEPGSNDTQNYDGNTQPHVSLAPGWSQPGPTPATLCDTPFDEDGNTLPGPFSAGTVPNIQPISPGPRVNEGQTVLTNGKNVGGRAGTPSAPGALDAGAATYDVQAGQGLRLQIGNTATIRFFRLRLTDAAGAQIPLVRIGGEGGLLDHARTEGGIVAGFDFKYDAGEILLDPGSRADVVAAIPASASQGDVLTLWTEDISRTGMGFAKTATVPVAHLHVSGAAGSPYTIADGTPLRAAFGAGALVEDYGPLAVGAILDPGTFVPVKPGMFDPNIKLDNNPLAVNGVVGHHEVTGDYTGAAHEGSARYAKLLDVLELTVENATDAHHPFHLHGFSIQPIDLTKPASPTYTFPYREFRDNIDVPARYKLRFRIRLDDRPLMDGVTLGGGLGRWVFHCHIFFHATFGMISEFDVVAPDGNEKPYVNAAAASVEVDEGQLAAMTGTYVDPDGDAVTAALNPPPIGTFIDNGDGTWSWSHTTTDGPDESQFLYVTATDAGGHKDQVVFGLVVNNLPPTVAITSPAPGALYAVDTPVTVTASITDPGSADVLSCAFNWDGGGPDSFAPAIAGSCSQTNTFTQAGVYTVSVTGSDDDGGTSAPATVMIVVYDPTAGFVTGGGTIESPAGAYQADLSLTGKASFGFVSKYHKGANVPVGNTEFTFHAASFKFKATAYQWLVVAGHKAQYKGTGTVNGGGSYGFLLTVTDGDLPGGGGVDKFRLKVWDPSAGDAVVYDNVLGASEDIDVASPQAIASGSIVIHKPK